MSIKNYDVIVLGTGGAGNRVAMDCRKAGWNVAIVNDGLFGGTCSVRGCIPKKVLAGTAEIIDITRRLHGLGVMNEAASPNWGELIRFKRTFTDPVPDRRRQALEAAGAEIFTGSPRFTDNLTIEVGDQTLHGKKVVIAVGAKSAKLPLEGFDHLITSDDFLELDELPKNIIFAGGGYISFEFAHIAARFGANVTILHSDDTPLPIFDRDIINELVAATTDIGVNVVMNARVQKIEKHDNRFVVTTQDGASYESDLVVHGAGRPPALAELNLEAAGVDYDKRRGVLVDDYLCSVSNPDVYAAGDAAAAGPPLSPVASRQGAIVADNLLGKPHKQPEYLSTASVIFTTPPVAMVGYLEQQAQEKGIEFDAITTDLTEWFDIKRFDLKHAKSKILVEKRTRKIVGAHLISSHAEDIISIFSLAIELGLTTEQLKTPIFAFPTATDDMRSMF